MTIRYFIRRTQEGGVGFGTSSVYRLCSDVVRRRLFRSSIGVYSLGLSRDPGSFVGLYFGFIVSFVCCVSV